MPHALSYSHWPAVARPFVRGSMRGRAGFSLIEILVVVGILALLVSLAVIGFRVVGGVMKSRSTTVAFESAQGMLTAYKLTNTTESLLPSGTVGGLTASPLYRWVPPLNPNGTANTAETYSVLTCQLAAPDLVYNGAGYTPIPEPDKRVLRARQLQDDTARVLRRLSQVPANQAAINATSADRITKIRFPADPTDTTLTLTFKSYDDRPQADYPPDTTGKLVDGVNLLDGYGHPIYFVPGGGLVGVNLGYTGKGDRADANNYDRQNQTVRAPDHQPFWASGGPDGDLSTGDDNVYSFER